ncbi:hypothetical protein [Streptomyces rochei]
MPALLLLVLVAVATAVLLRRGTGTYPPVRTFPAVGRAPREPGAPFRVLAVVAGWAAGLLYVWGLLITGLTVLEAED